MSSHPDDRMSGDPVIPDPTQPNPIQPGPPPTRAQPMDPADAAGTGPHDDPAGWGAADHAQRTPTAPLAQSELDRATRPDPTGIPAERDRDRGDGRSPVDEAVQSLSEPDNRARLLLAIAVMTGLTLLLTLGLLIDRLTEDDTEPVMVEGVPCLVEDGPEDTAVLYCQR